MSLNKVQLIGNVGKDPEVRYLDSGVAVATFPLATTDRAYTLANGTQVPERTEWHNIVLWRGLAETAEKYVHKGDKLYIEGKIRSRSYDDQNGVKRYVVEIFGDNMEMLTCLHLQQLHSLLALSMTLYHGRKGNSHNDVFLASFR